LVPADAVVFDCGEVPEGAADGVLNFFPGWYVHPGWYTDLDEKPVSWYMYASTFKKSRQMVRLDANVKLAEVIWI
jgi:peptidyl-prolyl isomerase D